VIIQNNKHQYLIFITSLLFFFPRINIFSFGEAHTAGLRIDDIILFFIFISLIFKGKIFKLNISKSHLIYFSFVFISFLSFFFNNYYEDSYLGGTSILYPIRYVEYFVFFVVGSLIVNHSSFIKIVLYLALYQIIIIIFQYLGFFPAFTSTDGINFSVVAGMTGGPWEVSIVLTLCFAVYVNHFSKLKYLIYSFIIIAVLTYINFYILGSRSSSVTFIVLTFILICLNIKNFCHNSILNKIIMTLILFISFIIIVLVKPILIESNSDQLNIDCVYSIEKCSYNMVLNRSGNLIKLDNYYLLIDFYKFVRTNVGEDKIPIGRLYNEKNNLNKIAQINFSNTNNIDLSWLMRMEKWIYGVSLWQDKLPHSIFLGIGPGAVGPSFDGSWLRLFVENGIVGLLLIIMFFVHLLMKNLLNFLPILAISLNMLFIDAFLAYKSVSLILFILGYYTSLKKNVNRKL